MIAEIYLFFVVLLWFGTLIIKIISFIISSRMNREHSVRFVFFGNVPDEMPLENLKEIFSVTGEVLWIEFVVQPDPNLIGYGFCLYKDEATACSTVSALNGYEIENRKLIVCNDLVEFKKAMKKIWRENRMELKKLLKENIKLSYSLVLHLDKQIKAINETIQDLLSQELYLKAGISDASQLLEQGTPVAQEEAQSGRMDDGALPGTSKADVEVPSTVESSVIEKKDFMNEVAKLVQERENIQKEVKELRIDIFQKVHKLKNV